MRTFTLRRAVGYLGCLVVASGIFYLRFTYLDMTDLRLLVAFWPYWIGLLVVACISIRLTR